MEVSSSSSSFLCECEVGVERIEGVEGVGRVGRAGSSERSGKGRSGIDTGRSESRRSTPD